MKNFEELFKNVGCLRIFVLNDVIIPSMSSMVWSLKKAEDGFFSV